MGLFSWCTSDTRKSIAVDMEGYRGCPKKVYLLNPFGTPYVETDYDGYGTFGGNDVYALVAKWNKPELCKDENGNWLPDIVIREIGIELACYDNDHVQLQYPIKIVEHLCDYEDAAISPSCPYQGYFYDYDDTVATLLEEVNDAFSQLEAAKECYSKLQLCLGHEEVYEKALKNSSNRFKCMVAKHPDTPESILLKLLREGDVYIHQQLVANKDLSNKVLQALEKITKSDYVHRKIKLHSNYEYLPLEKKMQEANLKQHTNGNVAKKMKDDLVK